MALMLGILDRRLGTWKRFRQSYIVPDHANCKGESLKCDVDIKHSFLHFPHALCSLTKKTGGSEIKRLILHPAQFEIWCQVLCLNLVCWSSERGVHCHRLCPNNITFFLKISQRIGDGGIPHKDFLKICLPFSWTLDAQTMSLRLVILFNKASLIKWDFFSITFRIICDTQPILPEHVVMLNTAHTFISESTITLAIVAATILYH